ncbi:MAG: hypothetical protein ACT4QG_06785 [Sporichthyaceae bacterium]
MNAGDATLARRVQSVGAWCGPAFTLLLFGGWGILAGFIPLISADDSPAEVAAQWRDNQELTLLGLSIALVGSFLLLAFYLTISLQMHRAERGTPFLSILQYACGIAVVLVLAIPLMIFIVGAFRPERSDELFVLINDTSYILLILPWPPLTIGLVALAVVTMADRRPDPVFPRWYAYVCLWVALLLIPANLIIFFKDGVFAWTGVIGFWMPAAVFGAWYWVTFFVLRAAIAQEARERAAGPMR